MKQFDIKNIVTLGIYLIVLVSNFAYTDTFPGASWETKSPEELGMDAAKVNDFASKIGGDGVLIKDGYLVKTWGDGTKKADWASASKPVVATMLFYAIKEGKLNGVNDLIDDLSWELIEKDKTMTFHHLANMISGYARGEAPGAAWAYNDYGVKLYKLSVFDKVFNEGSANDVAIKSTRLGALGFEDGSIFSSRGGYGLSTSPRDFARIGWFWLNKGNWDGQQLLSKQFFDDYMKAQVPGNLPRTTSEGSDYLGIGTDGGPSDQEGSGPGLYGYNWWFNGKVGTSQNLAWPDAPEDLFMASGHWNKELCVIVPSRGIVVAARGDWGTFDPGNASASMNTRLKLLGEMAPEVVPPDTTTGNSGKMQVNFITKYTQSSGGSGIWFGWEDEQAHKPKLEIQYRDNGVSKTKYYQHGLAGAGDAYAFFFKNGSWDGGGREFHKHNLNQKDSPIRQALFKADISDIPHGAQIQKATLHLHIHSEEGMGPSAKGVIGLFKCDKDWNWDYADWTNYDNGRPWDTEGGDYGDLIRNLDVTQNMRNEGYSKQNTEFPLDLTQYVIDLQANRPVSVNKFMSSSEKGANIIIKAMPNTYSDNISINIQGIGPDKTGIFLIHDISGTVVMHKVLQGNELLNGVTWDARSITSGLYYIVVKSENVHAAEKMMLLK
ncbi:MAG: serine hydrolase [Fibrobacteria bacterium]|nr:serine hydrolase [Fibrobacteria bacterium]